MKREYRDQINIPKMLEAGDKPTPEVSGPEPIPYSCSWCGASGVKLWRKYQVFANVTPLLCVDCALKAQKLVGVEVRDDGRVMDDGEASSYTIGSFVPAVPCETGSTLWNYTSIPSDRAAWWEALPLRITLDPSLVTCGKTGPRCTEQLETQPYSSSHIWNAGHHGLPAGLCIKCGLPVSDWINRMSAKARTNSNTAPSSLTERVKEAAEGIGEFVFNLIKDYADADVLERLRFTITEAVEWSFRWVAPLIQELEASHLQTVDSLATAITVLDGENSQLEGALRNAIRDEANERHCRVANQEQVQKLKSQHDSDQTLLGNQACEIDNLSMEVTKLKQEIAVLQEERDRLLQGHVVREHQVSKLRTMVQQGLGRIEELERALATLPSDK